MIKSVALSILAVVIFIFTIGFWTEIAHSPAGWNGALLMACVASLVTVIVLLVWEIPTYNCLVSLQC